MIAGLGALAFLEIENARQVEHWPSQFSMYNHAHVACLDKLMRCCIVCFGRDPDIQTSFTRKLRLREDRTKKGRAMNIFVQPRNGESFDRIVRRAVKILREAEILSAQAGILSDCPVVLIDRGEILEALAILEQAGVRASVTKYRGYGYPSADFSSEVSKPVVRESSLRDSRSA
jgi:hypothetical protein